MAIKTNKFLIISFLTGIIFLFQNVNCVYSFQEKEVPGINWETLNLSNAQRAQLKVLELKWQKTSNIINGQIIYDKNKLKYVLTNPFSTDKEIKELQNRILVNQKKLRYEAMENFLQKRTVLLPLQRQKLHEMISK
ncbi:MAG TPA: hypothetical protein P5556_02580 [Candidatus Gastranaerophilales bacterium]|nr:hypothetical protein [Candidatus Gastranaerophilales bacterium]